MSWKARNLPDRSVAQIQDEIAAAGQKRSETRDGKAAPSEDQPDPDHAPNIDYMEDDAVDVVPGLVDVSSLLTLDGPPFLRVAYRSVLCREIDQDGEDVYGRHLQKGMHRLEILLRLRLSEEGRKCHARFTGGFLHWLDFGFGRVPVLGFLYRWARDVILLPLKLRRIELRIAAMEDRLRRTRR